MADRLRSGVEVTTGWIQASRLGFCASAHAENLTITSTARYFCLLPRKRCCPLSPVKHPKILRPLRGGSARGCLAFRKQIIRNENQTTPKCFACSRPNVGVPNQFQA